MTELPDPLSLWMDTAPGPDRSATPLPGSADVVVLGAGIAGLTTAHLLAKAGRSVVVVEAAAVAGGVSGHTTAKVTAQHAIKYDPLTRRHGADAAARYGAAQTAALEWIATNDAELGIDCDFSRQDSYVYTADPSQVDHLKREADAAERAGLPASFVTEIPLGVPAVVAVRFSGQAQFHPRRWLLGLAEHIEQDGGRIVEGVRAEAIDEFGGPVVHTSHGDIQARDVVVATHYPIFDRGLFFTRLDPVRDLVVAGPVAHNATPQGMYLEARTHRSVRAYVNEGLPRAVVGGEHYRVGESVDVELRYRHLAHWAREHIGVNRVSHRWSAHDLSTVDLIPYVGRYHVAARHLWVATGFGQWGMTGGTAAGLLLRDLILGEDNPDAALFDPNRFDLWSTGSLVGNNITVAKHLIGDHIEALRDSVGPDLLAPGEATVTRAGGAMVAAYRTDDGRLHTVGAHCTHLGCLVAFNNAEKSWDCPCHGSRFDVDGSVLHGPATRPLSRRPD
jgi:glycine/D-amino acid oxidase-like deaminating enzyme/nitrite reductase/ring-hydroxylating ferredoxin subunit